MDSHNLSLVCREHNTTELSLFTFDVVHSLSLNEMLFALSLNDTKIFFDPRSPGAPAEQENPSAN